MIQYKDNPDAYQKTARHWTCAYAGAKNTSRELDEKIAKITEMGFGEVSNQITYVKTIDLMHQGRSEPIPMIQNADP